MREVRFRRVHPKDEVLCRGKGVRVKDPGADSPARDTEGKICGNLALAIPAPRRVNDEDLLLQGFNESRVHSPPVSFFRMTLYIIS